MKEKKYKLLIILSMAMIMKLQAIRANVLPFAAESIERFSDNMIFSMKLTHSYTQTMNGCEFMILKDGKIVKNGFKYFSESKPSVDRVTINIKEDLGLELIPETYYEFLVFATYVENSELKNYYYRLFFTTPAKPESEETTEIEETTTAEVLVNKPEKVILKTVKNIKKKSVVIKWRKAKNAQMYRVQYADNKSFKKAITKNTKKRSYVIRNLKKKIRYYVHVRGRNKNVFGRWSKVKSVVVKR